MSEQPTGSHAWQDGTEMGVERQRAVEALAAALSFPSGVVIRAWREEDCAEVRQLSVAEGWTTPLERPDETLEAWRRSWPALVAVSHNAVIGFCRAVSDGVVTTYVAELLVDPVWRRQGIAAVLLEVSQRLCPGSRLDLLATGASRPFYERLRFRPFAGYRLSWPERIAAISITQDAPTETP